MTRAGNNASSEDQDNPKKAASDDQYATYFVENRITIPESEKVNFCDQMRAHMRPHGTVKYNREKEHS